nr:MAG TPA: hypothetical protein [Caudoviricetes sp.]DAU00555.1 MAG TPA: hypothetical protein [Caudoviricetes sp.]DAV24831.1 MAG TPA: hypothetical protein [Caudoviricetes sp.]
MTWSQNSVENQVFLVLESCDAQHAWYLAT